MQGAQDRQSSVRLCHQACQSDRGRRCRGVLRGPANALGRGASGMLGGGAAAGFQQGARPRRGMGAKRKASEEAPCLAETCPPTSTMYAKSPRKPARAWA
eukprot:10439874-Alexandrium_andersonii.AAC.1